MSDEPIVGEVGQLIEATYRVIARTETLDPQVREILREAGLSNPAFYRHFRSKDELLVSLLERDWAVLRNDLARQMAEQTDPAAQIDAWVRGMLTPAVDPEAAQRVRPFTVNLRRLATLFPDEHRASRNALIQLLVAPLKAQRVGEGSVWPDAVAVYDLVKAVQDRHLVEETTPTTAEADHLVTFVLAALQRQG